MRPDPKRLAALNAFYAGRQAPDIMRDAVSGLFGGRVALVSSFGAESVVLLHMLSQADAATPVLFADTQMLFAQTLKYQQEVAERLGLLDVRRIAPAGRDLLKADPERKLHETDPDACCDLRKVRPLETALEDFDVVITGRKRHQTAERSTMEVFEQDKGWRLRVNPLVDWSHIEQGEYIDAHGLPRHPLVAKGFASLGCEPCTTPVAAGEDPRAGRWRGRDKEECGIHIVDGRVERKTEKVA